MHPRSERAGGCANERGQGAPISDGPVSRRVSCTVGWADCAVGWTSRHRGCMVVCVLGYTISGADMCHLLVDALVVLHLDVARAIHCRTIILCVSKACIS